MVTRDQEIILQNIMNTLIGSALVIEQKVRFNLARLLIRWYRLVLKGEDENSPLALELREKLDEILHEVGSIQARINS